MDDTVDKIICIQIHRSEYVNFTYIQQRTHFYSDAHGMLTTEIFKILMKNRRLSTMSNEKKKYNLFLTDLLKLSEGKNCFNCDTDTCCLSLQIVSFNTFIYE